MSIQAQFNDEAIDFLPKVKTLLKDLNGQDKYNLYDYALRRILISNKSLTAMSKEEIEYFDKDIIKRFEYLQNNRG